MIRIGIRVEGLVQGVGFRPFLYALAARFHLSGHVSNDSRGVSVEVEGERQDVTRFLTALEREAPPLALIEQVMSRQVPPNDGGISLGQAVLASHATTQPCPRGRGLGECGAS